MHAPVVNVSFGTAQMPPTSERSGCTMFRNVVRSKYNNGVVSKIVFVQIIQQTADVMVQHRNAAEVQVGILELLSDHLRPAGCRQCFLMRCDFVCRIQCSTFVRRLDRCVRFPEPEAGEKGNVFVALIQPAHSFVDDDFAHPAFKLPGLLTIAKEAFRVAAKVAFVRQPMIESMIARVRLNTGIEVARTMPLARRHRLVAARL